MIKKAQCFPESVITEGIEVVAIAMYLPNQSQPQQNHYVFAYRIRITNHSLYTVKLLRRKWIITDGIGEIREVEGEGVIGLQPILAPGEKHEYMSGTDMATPIGKMEGFYVMQYVHNEELFKVNIPAFTLSTPEMLN